jgi:Bifunctional DNA primase/polymerase, N-terminal
MENVKTQVGTSNRSTNLKSTALLYASAGLYVVPLHGVVNGRCTCGDDKCIQPGGHPRTKHGLANATTNRGVVEKMWAKWPKAKIGIALGARCKLLAVVADHATGLGNLRKLAKTHAAWSRTVRIADRSGMIFLFRFDRNHVHSGKTAEGVRLLGEGRNPDPTPRKESDIERILTIADGLTRKRDSIYTLLFEIYCVACSWVESGRARELRDATLKFLAIRVDRRTKRNTFRFLVEVGCRGMDRKLRSRYANALRYAYSCGCPSYDVTTFLKSKGGIEQCAKQFVMQRRKSTQAKPKVRLKRLTRW